MRGCLTIVRHLRDSICRMKWRGSERIEQLSKLCHLLLCRFLNLSGHFGAFSAKHASVFGGLWREDAHQGIGLNLENYKRYFWFSYLLNHSPFFACPNCFLIIKDLGISCPVFIFIFSVNFSFIILDSIIISSQITFRSVSRSDLFHISSEMAHQCKLNIPPKKLIFSPKQASLELEISELTFMSLFLYRFISFTVTPKIVRSFLTLCYSLSTDPEQLMLELLH